MPGGLAAPCDCQTAAAPEGKTAVPAQIVDHRAGQDRTERSRMRVMLTSTNEVDAKQHS